MGELRMAEEEKKENEDTAKEPHDSHDPHVSHDANAAESEPTTETEPAAESAPAPESKPASAETPAKSAEPDWKTLYALTLADFDNYKKRAARDREDTYRYAEADILKDILPVVDNLALALANAKEKADDPFVKGVKLVHEALLKTLKDHGAEPFDAEGQDLDPERMEAIAHLPHAEVPEGKVSIESKKGWMLKGKVLRAAQVVVSSGKQNNQE